MDSDRIRIGRIGWIRIQDESGFGFAKVDSNPPDPANPESDKGRGFEYKGLDSLGSGGLRVVRGGCGGVAGITHAPWVHGGGGEWW